jgi:hypothetical protein
MDFNRLNPNCFIGAVCGLLSLHFTCYLYSRYRLFVSRHQVLNQHVGSKANCNCSGHCRFSDQEICADVNDFFVCLLPDESARCNHWHHEKRHGTCSWFKFFWVTLRFNDICIEQKIPTVIFSTPPNITSLSKL